MPAGVRSRALEIAALRVEPGQLPAIAGLAALGIVYGDIGTSPLYAFKQLAPAGGTPSPEIVMGVISLILWSLILVVSLKYAILIMRADNHGEGGIVALLFDFTQVTRPRSAAVRPTW